MRALVTGATGFVGRRLLQHLDRPVVLSRDPAKARAALGNVEAHAWDPSREAPPAAAFEGVDAVFHLAGEPVAEGRWNAAKKARIADSRILGTRNLVAGLAAARRRPTVLVSASAVGFYGSRGDEVLDETAAPGEGFLAAVCRGWEAEARAAEAHGVRVACPRIGIVLGEEGGALGRLLPLFRFGIGGRLTLAGKQWMPWIHVDDLVRLLLHAAATPAVSGPLNAVAPAPARNRDFTRALGAAVGMPALFPVPALALRALAGEFAAVLLASQRVIPEVAERTGFKFRHAQLEEALRDAVSPAPAGKLVTT